MNVYDRDMLHICIKNITCVYMVLKVECGLNYYTDVRKRHRVGKFLVVFIFTQVGPDLLVHPQTLPSTGLKKKFKSAFGVPGTQS